MSGKSNFKILLICGIGILCLCLVFYYLFYPRFSFLQFTTPQTLSQQSLSNLPELQVGDTILRKGIGAESVVIANLAIIAIRTLDSSSQRSLPLSYTQAQMIIQTSSTASSSSSFDEFLSNAQNIAIKRYVLDEQARINIRRAVPLWLDKEFVLSTDTQVLYCTTLLDSILSPYTTIDIAYEQIDMPIFHGKYLFPKAFYEDKNSVIIYEK